jgi:Family of unknown function (DUF5677)
MADPVSKRVQEVHSWNEVPDFVSESEELDYLATHGLAEDFFQPSQEMIVVLEEIQGLLDRLGECLDDVQSWEQYESDITAENLLRILRRDVEGILCLANRDILLLPPALVIARSIIETFANLLWLIQPEDGEERESRLLACLTQERKTTVTYMNELQGKEDISWIENDLVVLDNYYDHISKKVEIDYSNVAKPSKFDKLLKEINKESLYFQYRKLSQSTHSTHAATWICKRDIEPRDWHTPLFLCYYTLSRSGRKFLERFGGDPNKFIDGELQQKVETALKSLEK